MSLHRTVACLALALAVPFSASNAYMLTDITGTEPWTMAHLGWPNPTYVAILAVDFTSASGDTRIFPITHSGNLANGLDLLNAVQASIPGFSYTMSGPSVTSITYGALTTPVGSDALFYWSSPDEGASFIPLTNDPGAHPVGPSWSLYAWQGKAVADPSTPEMPLAAPVPPTGGPGVETFGPTDVYVQYWAGTGNNRAVFIMDFADGPSDVFAFGYRWDTGTPTAWDAMRAIAASGPLGFDFIDYWFGTFVDRAGYGTYLSDGDMTYMVDDTGFGTAWELPFVGVSGHYLSNGSFFALLDQPWDVVFEQGLVPRIPTSSGMEAVPEPCTTALMLFGLCGLAARRRRAARNRG